MSGISGVLAKSADPKVARKRFEKTHPGTKKLRKTIGEFIRPKPPTPPKAPPPSPRISSADASGRRALSRLKRRRGLGSTVLTAGLGQSSASAATGTI